MFGPEITLPWQWFRKQTNKQHFMLNLAATGLVRPDPCLLATSVSNFPLLPDPGAGTGAVADF